jgi:hypothetical protein
MLRLPTGPPTSCRKVGYAAAMPLPISGAPMVLPPSRPKPAEPLRGRRLLGILALALMLGGCDNCGDWFGVPKGQGTSLDACRKGPAPQQTQ